MSLTILDEAPCGSERPNCRVLAEAKTEPKGLCQVHTAWCPDEHRYRPSWAARSVSEQRNFRTGG